jgi:hypothetical protein
MSRKEDRYRMFEKRKLKKIFESVRDKATGDEENCTMKSSVIRTLSQVS